MIANLVGGRQWIIRVKGVKKVNSDIFAVDGAIEA